MAFIFCCKILICVCIGIISYATTTVLFPFHQRRKPLSNSSPGVTNDNSCIEILVSNSFSVRTRKRLIWFLKTFTCYHVCYSQAEYQQVICRSEHPIILQYKNTKKTVANKSQGGNKTKRYCQQVGISYSWSGRRSRYRYICQIAWRAFIVWHLKTTQ